MVPHSLRRTNIRNESSTHEDALADLPALERAGLHSSARSAARISAAGRKGVAPPGKCGVHRRVDAHRESGPQPVRFRGVRGGETENESPRETDDLEVESFFSEAEERMERVVELAPLAPDGEEGSLLPASLISLILLNARPEEAARLLVELPLRFQGQSIDLIVTGSAVDTSSLEREERDLAKALRPHLSGEESSGVESAVRILRAIATTRRLRRAIEAIAAVNSGAVSILQNQLFVFEDVTRIDDREFQVLLGRVDNQTLARAMKDASNAVRDRFLGNMSDRRVSGTSFKFFPRSPSVALLSGHYPEIYPHSMSPLDGPSMRPLQLGNLPAGVYRYVFQYRAVQNPYSDSDSSVYLLLGGPYGEVIAEEVVEEEELVEEEGEFGEEPEEEIAEVGEEVEGDVAEFIAELVSVYEAQDTESLERLVSEEYSEIRASDEDEERLDYCALMEAVRDEVNLVNAFRITHSIVGARSGENGVRVRIQWEMGFEDAQSGRMMGRKGVTGLGLAHFERWQLTTQRGDPLFGAITSESLEGRAKPN